MPITWGARGEQQGTPLDDLKRFAHRHEGYTGPRTRREHE